MAESIRERQKRLTRETICNSFLALLKDKSIDKITVADVCRRAEINRGTFYLHFLDINDLKAYINSWYISELSTVFSHERGEDIRESFREIAGIILAWPEYSITMLGEERGEELISEVERYATETFLSRRRGILSEEQLTADAYRFMALLHGSWAILRTWCRNGLKEPADMVISCLDIFNFEALQ